MPSVAFSPRQPLLAVASGRLAELWDVTDPSRPVEVPALIATAGTGAAGTLWGVAFGPDGGTLAALVGDGTVRVVTADLGQVAGATLATLPGSTPARSVGYAPDGRTVAVGDADGTILVWSAVTPVIRTVGGAPGTLRPSLRPDGRVMTSAGAAGTVGLWDVADPRRPALASTVAGPVDDAGFDGDGRALLAVGQDRGLRLWDVTDPARASPLGTVGLPELIDTRSAADGVAFAPGGRWLLAYGDDGAVQYLVDLDLADLARTLCARPGSRLDPAEWRRYLPDLPYRPPCRPER